MYTWVGMTEQTEGEKEGAFVGCKKKKKKKKRIRKDYRIVEDGYRRRRARRQGLALSFVRLEQKIGKISKSENV